MIRFVLGLTLICMGETAILAEEILFADNFNKGLSDKWEIVGLSKEDYRIRKGALEIRVQPGKLTNKTPLLKVTLPFTTENTVTASVEVEVLDRFTEPAEFAGLYLISEGEIEFGARKQRVNGHMVFSPGNDQFIGKPGEEGDPTQYALIFQPANHSAGALKIIVRNNYAHFQVGPSKNGKYQNFFHSAIKASEKDMGFSLVAAGGPIDAEHWVRFDNFVVSK